MTQIVIPLQVFAADLFELAFARRFCAGGRYSAASAMRAVMRDLSELTRLRLTGTA
jgi:hypothetical protein